MHDGYCVLFYMRIREKDIKLHDIDIIGIGTFTVKCSYTIFLIK